MELSATQAPQESGGAQILPLSPADDGERRQPRVLVVDEHKVLTQGVREALEHSGITVLGIATNAETAVAQLANGLADAVIFCMKTDKSAERVAASAPAAAPSVNRPVRPEASYVVFNGLTTREQQVLRLLVEGASNKEMAKRLSIRSNTVRTHVQNLLAKLRVHTRLEAATLAIRGGLLEPDVVGAATPHS